MTHRDRAGDASGQRAGRREAAGDAGHRQGFPTPSDGSPARSLWVIINDPWYYGGRADLPSRWPELRVLAKRGHSRRCPASPGMTAFNTTRSLAKDVQWHGLSRARRPPFRPGEILDVGVHARAFYRTCSRIELPGLDFLAGSVGVGFSLSGFLRRFRLCPLAGPSFGHAVFAFPSCFVEL